MSSELDLKERSFDGFAGNSPTEASYAMYLIQSGKDFIAKKAAALAHQTLLWALRQPQMNEALRDHYRCTIGQILKDASEDPSFGRELLAALTASGYLPRGGILGEPEIMRALDRGKVKISPRPDLYADRGHPLGQQSAFNPTSVSIQLGTSFRVLNQGVIIDRRERSRWDYINSPEFCSHVELEDGDIFAILPIGCTEKAYYQMERRLWEKYGDRLHVAIGFLVALTRQTIEFPLPEEEGGEAYAGFLTARSSYARTGLGCELAPRLHLGDKQLHIALELFNVGGAVQVLMSGREPIVQLTIMPVTGAPARSSFTEPWSVRGCHAISGANGTNGVLILPSST